MVGISSTNVNWILEVDVRSFSMRPARNGWYASWSIGLPTRFEVCQCAGWSSALSPPPNNPRRYAQHCRVRLDVVQYDGIQPDCSIMPYADLSDDLCARKNVHVVADHGHRSIREAYYDVPADLAIRANALRSDKGVLSVHNEQAGSYVA